MARPENPIKADVIVAIRDLSRNHGVKDGCKLARERYARVPAGTWGRWRQEAIGNITEQQDADRLSVAAIAGEVRAQIPAPEHLVPEMFDPVPATRRALDFWRMLDELELDAQLLRKFALVEHADGTKKVRVPFALRDAHKMRCDLIRLALQQAEVAYGVDRAARFFDAVVAEIEAESPEAARRITQRLSRLRTDGELRGF